jgi:Zn-dependent peptidase ImmA (M78 family)/transcriptional regulator with XRE-family HTH domain
MSTLSHTVLRWARETAGMSIEEAAEALNSPLARIKSVEAGDEQPSRPMLLKMSKQYRRSLLTFYLAEPPKRGDRGQDFRTLPPEQSIEDEAALDALIRDLKARQSVVRSVVEDDEESEPLGFVGSKTMQDGVPAVVKAIRETLGVSLSEYRAKADYDDAFDFLRDRSGSAGIFVILVGDLGSYHSAMRVELFRGFAIADSIAPFVVINDNDSRPAWTFTLLHEIAHLLLGTTGISGTQADKDIERFCNDVAGEFLLPSEEVRDFPVSDATPLDDAIELIKQYARTRFVSRAMVAYKLLRMRKVTREKWQILDGMFRDISRSEREKYKAQQQKRDSGPSYYVVRRHRLGKALLGLIRRTLDAGTISPVKAAKALGVKPRAVYPLLVDPPRGTV